MDPSSTLPETGEAHSSPRLVLDESSRDGMRVFLSSYVALGILGYKSSLIDPVRWREGQLDLHP
jgi:hypothetical protein